MVSIRGVYSYSLVLRRRVFVGVVVSFRDKRVRLPWWFPLNPLTYAMHVAHHCSFTEFLRDVLLRRKPSCFGTLLSLIYKRCLLCPFRKRCLEELEHRIDIHYRWLEKNLVEG